MTDPTPSIGDAIGTMIHGGRWPAVKAAHQARIADAARAETRQARSEQFRRDIHTAALIAAAVLVLVILTGLAVAVWTWAL